MGVNEKTMKIEDLANRKRRKKVSARAKKFAKSYKRDTTIIRYGVKNGRLYRKS